MMTERKHRPDCPTTYWPDKPERCRCMFMALLDQMVGPVGAERKGAPHLHLEYVEGCFRCDLNRDEALS